MRMYDYTLQFQQLEDLLNSGTLDEETYKDTLESIEGDANEKVWNVARMIDNFKAQVDMLKSEKKKLNEKQKIAENNIIRLTDSLEEH
ncbi:MAG TPA: siphovirus Gp157 family protein, partial [Massilibacterium sp.]|nr:siphovirus Gp157 family protein [Massilibacterium sp.]